MVPYYQDEFMSLYLGDCREIIPQLNTKVDAVITDPPYGMSYHSGHYKYENPFKPIEGDDKYPIDLLPIFRQIASKAVLLFARWETLKEIDEPDSVIVWVKNNWTAGDLNHEYARQWEAILFYKGPNHQFYNGRPSDVIYCDRVPPTTHPTEKPEELLNKIILQNTDVGDVIFDPYLGSGTTAFCAKKLQRKAICIEIDERYCELAARRCSQQSFNLGI
jgi:site-specific DNA-methyltransferase (adenine-specific)